jgi:hypothetical protein
MAMAGTKDMRPHVRLRRKGGRKRGVKGREGRMEGKEK